MPRPRSIRVEEHAALLALVEARFGHAVGSDAEVRAAGQFRFVETPRFSYLDRTDLGSVAFEVADYGISDASLDSTRITRDALLPRVDAALKTTGLEADGRQFVAFQDEFAGAVQPRGLSIDFDPRASSVHVARTIEYRRSFDGVPVFGSELLVGLMPDGTIGRLRLHWPGLDEAVVTKARALVRSVKAGAWSVPPELRSDDVEILEVSAGVGHSGFADPRYRVLPVVRVLYRRTSKDPNSPLASTGYRYFDAAGREVDLGGFPEVKGMPASAKEGGR